MCCVATRYTHTNRCYLLVVNPHTSSALLTTLCSVRHLKGQSGFGTCSAEHCYWHDSCFAYITKIIMKLGKHLCMYAVLGAELDDDVFQALYVPPGAIA